MYIADKKISLDSEPFIIAEMSGNHNQSLEKALQIVDAAAAAGASALKLQTYTADTITLDVKEKEFNIKDPNSLWHGESLHDLYDKAHTPWDWHEAIMDRAKQQGMICFSSPFDESAVDFLEELDVPAYKLASFEINHIPLIKKIGATGKPIIISTGMAGLGEIEEAITTARDSGCGDIAILKCTSTYPATPENSNIKTIGSMRDIFHCEVGLSDHTLGIGVPVAAVACGATVIEKHFTLSRAEGGVDSAFSLEPGELAVLVTESRRAWQALGKVSFGPTDPEKESLVFRRSLYIAEDIRAGEAFTPKNLRVIRPGLGLHPRFYDEFIGRKAARNLRKGEPVSWEMI